MNSASAAKRERGHHDSISLRKRLLFAAIVCITFFAALELTFAVVGLGDRPVVGKLQLGFRDGVPIYDADGIEVEGEGYQLPLFEADPWLSWKPIADTPYTGVDGLRKPVPSARPKAAGVYRIAVLGDSCSFLGRYLYVNRLEDLLQEHCAMKVDVVNASCPAYSSFQGVRRLDEVLRWEPDILIVYFGWNDHWQSLNGKTDAEVAANREVAGGIAKVLHFSRVYWTIFNLAASNSAVTRGGEKRNPSRVPLEDYRDNLHHIAGKTKQSGCSVVFITAPTMLIENQMSQKSIEFFGKFHAMNRRDVEAIPATHAAYNEAVRKTAKEFSHADLVDLERLWKIEEMQDRFRADGIHFTETGHRQVAKELFQMWREVHSDGDCQRAP